MVEAANPLKLIVGDIDTTHQYLTDNGIQFTVSHLSFNYYYIDRSS